MSRPAVFLDRDGTLNRPLLRAGKPYPPTNVAEFTLMDGVSEGCRALKAAGFVLVVITNQPDVGRGMQSRESVEAIHARLAELLPVDRVEVCYASGAEHPEDPRRKPQPGMVFDAAKSLELDLTRSWMVGDRWRDVDCGRTAGLRTIFIDWDYEENLHTSPEFTVRSFPDAVRIILSQSAGLTPRSPA